MSDSVLSMLIDVTITDSVVSGLKTATMLNCVLSGLITDNVRFCVIHLSRYCKSCCYVDFILRIYKVQYIAVNLLLMQYLVYLAY